MTIQITTAADERLYDDYKAARDAPRFTMAYGVYPNAAKALSQYADLVQRLTDGDLAKFGVYHAIVTAQVAPYISAMQTAMTSIVEAMNAIEQAAPGTFPGINQGANGDE